MCRSLTITETSSIKPRRPNRNSQGAQRSRETKHVRKASNQIKRNEVNQPTNNHPISQPTTNHVTCQTSIRPTNQLWFPQIIFLISSDPIFEAWSALTDILNGMLPRLMCLKRKTGSRKQPSNKMCANPPARLHKET